MIRKGLRALRRRLESLFAVANFGAASLFWLVAAFLVSATDYGSLMTIQASVLLLVGIFTLRTQDLIYYLLFSRGYGLERSYRAGIAIECLAALACVIVGSIIVLWLARARFSEPGLVSVFLLAAAAAVVQQSSIARLRRLGLTHRILVADAATLATWAGAAAYLAAGMPGPKESLLVAGAAPQAIRSVVAAAGALAARAPVEADSAPVEWRFVFGFLARGQAINVVKNGATSIETLIVAAFFNPALVAMYRLTKSTQGLAGAVSNVAFQQGMGSLADAGSGERRRLWREVRRRGWRACLVAYLFGVIFALAYAWQKPEVGVWEFQSVMAASYFAFLPAVLLQGSFIVLSIAGLHGLLNRAYLVSAAALVVLSACLLVVSELWVFLVALTFANWLRTWLLDGAAKRELERREPSPGHGRSPLTTESLQ